MTTSLNKVLREYASGAPTLAAGQWGQDQLTGRIHAMRRDGVTRDIFFTLADISAALLSGSANILQLSNGAGAIGDSILAQSGGNLIQSFGQNGSTLFSVQNTTSDVSSLAGLSLVSNGGLGASLFLASSAYTDDAGAASRLNISSGGLATGINVKGNNATDTVNTYFGSAYSSGNLFHTISNKGIKLQNIALTTDADGTVAGIEHLFSITKDDTNTRRFYGYKLLATLNTGGSNTNTTIDLASWDTVNTALNGLTLNLGRWLYGGAEKARITSAGTLVLQGDLMSATLTDNYLVFQSSGKLTTTTLRYDANKVRLGIGAIPDSALVIAQDSDSLAAMTMVASASTPTSATTSTAYRIYLKGGKLVIIFDDAGTVRYKYLDLTGTGVTWVHSTSAP